MAIINAITDTWNNAGTVFTAIKMTVTNTASASGSKLIDLLVGASSKFSVDKDGAVVLTGQVTTNVGTFASAVANGASAKGFAYNTPAYTTTAKLASWANNGAEKAYIQQDGVFCSVGNGSETSPLFKGSAGRGFYEGAGGLVATDGTTALAVFSSSKFVWTAGAVIGFNVSGSVQTNQNVDTGLQRQAAGVWRINNGTAGTNTGTAFSTGAQTIAQLPAAATAGAGARSFVTDATATTFLTTVTGGGANKVPVVSDGTNWLIG